MLSRDLIDYIFSHNEDASLIRELQHLFDKNENDFTVAAAEAIDNALEARIELCPQPLRGWLASLKGLQQKLPRFLYAQFLVRQSYHAEALEVLLTLAASSPKADPFLILPIVRLQVRLKRFAQAAEWLKLALSLSPPYSCFVKSEKILKKILSSGQWQPRRKLKIALLGSSTTSFLAPVLQAACFKIGIQAEVYEGGYGNFRQDILDAASPLYAFKPQAVIVLLNHRDLALPPVSPPDTAQHFARDLKNFWSILQQRNPCHLIQVGFDLPPYGSWGLLEDTQSGGRARIVRAINALLADNLPTGVSFFDIDRIGYRVGKKFHSDIEWYSSKQYPALEALPVLAEHLAANIRAAFGYASKVLVLDLDNTLWGGVIGEDGLSGIVLGPPSPEGEAYLELQRYAKELKERGVLLAVCSKNNLEDAQLPFREHDSMILQLDDFVAFIANWNDKAANIQQMAQGLSLGLDSFVFLDDNPLERSWVRSQLPDIAVPECDSKPWDMLKALRSGMYFETIALTEEDFERHKSYKSNIARQNFEKNAVSVEDFLAGLEMISESGPVDALTITRVTQLINKTNQFNLTTRRYTEEQVRSMAESGEWWTRWFRLKDKFGDHGLIGVMLGSNKNKTWRIDTWLMSCRVLGRKMEVYMAKQFLQEAAKAGAREIIGEYIPTAKNSLVKDLYLNVGFNPMDEPNKFIFNLKDSIIPTCDFISPPITK